jgi:hypothetical protein
MEQNGIKQYLSWNCHYKAKMPISSLRIFPEVNCLTHSHLAVDSRAGTGTHISLASTVVTSEGQYHLYLALRITRKAARI